MPPDEQNEYPTDYFRSPLGIPLVLSGNFAEMREGHFHGGLDIKTRESEGYRIYAAADGYIARVKVSPFGYGNALYVAHPNGYTTVYAHLSRFKGEIASYVRRSQYDRKSFAIDRYPEPGRFPVKKGQTIALSGNSGSSSGPHLHFEVRTTRDQVPVNPLLFGFEIDDSRVPRIFRIRIYPADDESGVIAGPEERDPRDPLTLDVESVDGVYRLAGAPVIQAWGRIRFGIQTHDYHNGSRSRLGAYRIALNVDGEPTYVSTMERISFGDTRYINAHVDYAERRENRRWIQRSHRLPGNKLPIYKHRDDGIVRIAPGDTTGLEYVVEDASGNLSTLGFAIVGLENPPGLTVRQPAGSILARYGSPVVLSREDFKAELPADALYEDAHLLYANESGPPGSYSGLHVFHDPRTPLHRRYALSIRPSGLPASLQDKALVAELDEDGETSSVGGSYEKGLVTVNTRSFGKFFVTVDTTAPTIQSLDLKPGTRLGRRSQIRFRIKDDLSGIVDYAGYVDGRWALFAYDAKRNMLTYDVDPRLKAGDHELTVTAVDRKQNEAALSLTFVK